MPNSPIASQWCLTHLYCFWKNGSREKVTHKIDRRPLWSTAHQWDNTKITKSLSQRCNAVQQQSLEHEFTTLLHQPISKISIIISQYLLFMYHMTLLSKLHTGESNSEKENLESQNTIFLKVIKCRSHKTENYFIASISLLHNTIIMKKLSRVRIWNKITAVLKLQDRKLCRNLFNCST